MAIDADPQGGLTNLLAPFTISQEVPLFQHRLFETLTKGKAEPLQLNSHLHILTASYELDRIAWTLPPYEIRDLLKGKRYDNCIIDCPPSLQGISLASILASELSLVPCEVSRSALRPTLYTVEAIKKADRKYKVLLIGYKEPRPEQRGYNADAARHYKQSMNGFFTIPRSIAAVKLAVKPEANFTAKSIEDIQKPLLSVIGVKA